MQRTLPDGPEWPPRRASGARAAEAAEDAALAGLLWPGYGTGLARAPEERRERLRPEAMPERLPPDPLPAASDPAAALAGELGSPGGGSPRSAPATLPKMLNNADIRLFANGTQQLDVSNPAQEQKEARRAPAYATGLYTNMRATKSLV